MKKYKNLSNIDILKKYVAGERPFVQVGYQPKEVRRKNGETWTDAAGKTWKKTETGAVISVNSQVDLIRSMLTEKCKCGQNIKYGSRRDELFFRRTGLCENCLIDYETKLRIAGVYPDYENYKLISYELGFIKDARDKVKEVIKYFSNNSGDVEMLCNSEGFLERWKCNNREQIVSDAAADLKLAQKRIGELTKYKKVFQKKYVDGAKKNNLEIYV